MIHTFYVPIMQHKIIAEWCLDKFGNYLSGKHEFALPLTTYFQFLNDEDAMLFQLRWGGLIYYD